MQGQNRARYEAVYGRNGSVLWRFVLQVENRGAVVPERDRIGNWGWDRGRFGSEQEPAAGGLRCKPIPVVMPFALGWERRHFFA